MIYITGSGRSGSSWFAEMVSKNEGVLDWDYWNWDERFCLRNIKQ